MKNKECLIVGAGCFDGLLPGTVENAFVIAADGGYAHLGTVNITPDVLLGDFDSLEVVPEHKHLIRHSPIKDDTDMALSVAYALEEGYETFYLYGGLGGRLDHTLANLQLLVKLSQMGKEAYLIGEGIILTAATGETVRFSESASGMISVFSATDKSSGVTECNLKYVLDDAILTNNRALGVSNEFIGESALIQVKSGTLILSWNMSNGLPVERRKNETE